MSELREIDHDGAERRDLRDRSTKSPSGKWVQAMRATEETHDRAKPDHAPSDVRQLFASDKPALAEPQHLLLCYTTPLRKLGAAWNARAVRRQFPKAASSVWNVARRCRGAVWLAGTQSRPPRSSARNAVRRSPAMLQSQDQARRQPPRSSLPRLRSLPPSAGSSQ